MKQPLSARAANGRCGAIAAVALLTFSALDDARAAEPELTGTLLKMGTPRTYEAYGCMLRKNDAPMKAVMDAAIIEAQKSGVAAKMYQRWFQQPIPPKRINLDFPLSSRMQALFANPDDKPTS
ncbi:transporter substrate-binding domain-containing protein [Paraburkholderia caledonica]|uniref:ABC-type amino acid transport substrate-binding protein n=1 Tax=Paraburkholderia caledonica TaxID=134536 RepID=A0ABU1KTY5_9BURK|nr:transporter substrate-binding domain-containing protein [Paraburkholderia caledonica]MDR6374419.1 ABC-type amino acid transport substrate-binding protein [Paraburkholderia caledonica]